MDTTKTMASAKSDENKCATNFLQHHQKQQLERNAQHAAQQARHQWRRSWCTSCASSHIARTLPHLMIISHHLAQVLSKHFVIHGHIHGRTSLTRFSLSISACSFLSFSVHFLHSELFSELDNPIVMESLCYFANKGSDDAYDVSTSFASCEPNVHDLRRTLRLINSPFLHPFPRRCPLKHTEDNSTAAYQKACQSVSRRL